ncbi:MAG: dTMP kinase [Leptospiraceae bacterium]|nr:dTMP kinase [Leptospiraceae bacterium]MDW7975475.1 dTMP kinase [Leptospiraceae bacterium]
MQLYVLEGLDGAGKTTAIEYLKKFIKKLKIHDSFAFFYEPTDFSTGKQIREHLKKKTLLTTKEWIELFDRDRRENYQRNLLPNQEKKIILDRYYISTSVYQAQKEKEVEDIFYFFYNKYPKPTMVFFLNISVDLALKRLDIRSTKNQQAKEIFEKEEELKRIQQNYTIAKQLCQKHHIFWVDLDSQKKPHQLAKEILEMIFSESKNQ